MLQISDLSIKFKDKEVLKGLNLNVPSNSVFGFVGKNGAGKTTTMKIILGLLKPDNGKVYVNGEELVEDYLKEEPLELNFGPYEVPEDSYFVMGDNRNWSHDARFWDNTYVHRDKIVAKAWFKYYPDFESIE